MIQMIIEGLLIPLVTIFGLCGNVVSIIVLRHTRLDMKWSFRCLLIMLAMFDTIFITCITISFSMPQIWSTWRQTIHPHIFPWLLPFIQMSLNGSIWSIVAVAVERVSSVVCLQRNRHFSSPTLIYILPVLTLTMLWNIPRFMEVYTCSQTTDDRETSQVQRVTQHQPDPKNISNNFKEIYETNSSSFEVLSICPTELRRNLLYIQYYILIGNFVIMVLVPFVLLVILNGYLYRVIISKRIIRSSARQTRDQKIAKILITIVLIFFVCSLPRVVINTYEVFHLLLWGDPLTDWPAWCDQVSAVSHLLLVINSSINILIYTARDDKFRIILIKMFTSKRNVLDKNFVRRRFISVSDTSRLSALFSGSATDGDTVQTVQNIQTGETQTRLQREEERSKAVEPCLRNNLNQ